MAQEFQLKPFSEMLCNCCVSEDSGAVDNVHTGVLGEELNTDELQVQEEQDFEFTAQLDRTTGVRLGINVTQIDKDGAGQSTLKITSLETGEFAGAIWNEANPAKEIKTGDYIVSANGQFELKEMVKQCKQWHILNLVLVRKAKG
uniref:PDZ domain-containing protein n=1 Tax=Noctiluca scintillans TaxID=2966 RepID=A0A7S1EW23_NOCSC